ncbi:hypothetical protein LTR17_019017 [Elasticomyces elasticus]|nr:hypothetical protein LTR17_019017 [Elasticomyces elasticus]
MIVSDNEVTITVNAHDTCWPTIPARRLSHAVLTRLQHMCLILDCTDYFNSSYADVDFDAFKSLTGLRTLRIAMVYRKHYDTQTLAPLHIPQLREFNVVAQILERVPASTRLLFGTEPDSAQHDLIKASNGLSKSSVLLQTRSPDPGHVISCPWMIVHFEAFFPAEEHDLDGVAEPTDTAMVANGGPERPAGGL